MSVFHFKSFSISQANSAMKVSTDACLFGAIAASIPEIKKASKILDVGAGTGLLTLMLAQANSLAIIDAIEIDDGAAADAKKNLAASPWSNRLQVYHTDANCFSASIKYDFIISNPPFHENQLAGSEKTKNLAHHDAGLTLQDLFQIADRHLAAHGLFTVLLPYYRKNECLKLAGAFNLYAISVFCIRHTIDKKPKRIVLVFSRKNQATKPPEQEIIIYGDDGKYTQLFVDYLKNYYYNL